MELLTSSRIENVTADVYLRHLEGTWEVISDHVEGLAETDAEAAQQCLYDIKYEGSVTRQKMEVDKQHRMAAKRIPDSFDYQRITPLRDKIAKQ